MSHIHWVTRQNKLEIPIDKDEVNKREIRECDGRTHDPDTMVAAPLTPKRHEKPNPSSGCHRPLPQVVKKTLHWRKWHYHGIVARTTFLKLKQKSETPQRKSRTHVPTQISMRHPPHPNHTPIHHTNAMDERVTQRFYYETIIREVRNECRCDERLQSKTKEFTRLAYTGLVVELEHILYIVCLLWINCIFGGLFIMNQ
jgi:hypothetical protein